jgi:hypothetical protein
MYRKGTRAFVAPTHQADTPPSEELSSEKFEQLIPEVKYKTPSPVQAEDCDVRLWRGVSQGNLRRQRGVLQRESMNNVAMALDRLIFGP